MKSIIHYFIDGKALFLSSFFAGSTFTAFTTYIIDNTPKHILGYSVSIWLMALVVNIWDIHTGIQADIKKRKSEGSNFVYDADKGWKAFEKIIGFTVVIGFIYLWEIESIRLGYSDYIVTILNGVKSIFFIYVIMIELKSIGNNNKARFGVKGELFRMLDNIIRVVNKGIIDRISSFVSGSKTEPIDSDSEEVEK